MNNNSSGQRKLSIYERNQLLRAGLSSDDLLSKGEMPVEYLTGNVKFKGLTIKVNRNVLIPRVETEDLVDLIVEDLLNRNLAGINYLELGTGSGAISLAVLTAMQKRSKTIEATLTDISKAALALAKENFNNLLPNLAVNFLESDLLDNLSTETKFDLIIANLPYIPKSDMSNLAASVKDFEPHLALNGGEDGFFLIAELLKQVLEKKCLSKEGKIYLEVDQSHNQEFVEAHYPELWQSFAWQFKKDHLNRNRFIVLSLKSV